MDLNTLGASTSASVVGAMPVLIVGIILIIATIVLLALLKRIIVNSILGIIAWLIVSYIFPIFGLKLSIPFWPSLILSILFGLAGIGSILVLAFLGIV